MFTIQKANLANNGFEQQTAAECGILDLNFGLSSKNGGLNFYEDDGSIYFYAGFSKKVKKALSDGTMTVDQLLNQGFITKSDFDKGDGKGVQTYYWMVLPNELRGGQVLGKVKDVIAKAQKLVRKTITVADISKMIEV